MIIIKAKSANEAWLKAFQHIWNEGLPTDNKKYIRDEPTLIEITDPTIEKVDKRFPMAQTEIDTINHFICTGENEAAVNHEWTKIYYHRAFDEPHSFSPVQII